MKVDGVKTIRETIEISNDEVKRIAFTYISDKTGWRKDWYIKDGKVCRDVEYCTSHCWDETEEIRDATEEDVIAYKFISRLK